MLYGRSLASLPSPSIVTAMCFSRMRNVPCTVEWSFSLSFDFFPGEIERGEDGLVALERDERLPRQVDVDPLLAGRRGRRARARAR